MTTQPPAGRIAENDRYYIRSSNGDLTCDACGIVTSCESEGDEDGDHLQRITRFNIAEWLTYWGKLANSTNLDILDLGYWYYNEMDGSESYQEPEMGWRLDIAHTLFQRQPAGGI